MKAAIYHAPGAPDVLKLEEVIDPAPARDELLVRIEAISVEGGDLGRRANTSAGIPPRVLGYAASGKIVGMGEDVAGFEIGQNVTTFAFDGSHAELRAVPAATSWIVPEGLDMGVAAAIPCGPGTAAYALQLGQLEAGQTVLVQGAAGGVGIAAIQLATKAGARVIGTGTNGDTLEKLKSYGLSDAIVTGEEPSTKQVRALVGDAGVDLLIDNVGGPALANMLPVVKEGGRAVIIGVFGGREAWVDARQLLRHRHTLIGCLLGAVMHTPPIRDLIGSLLQSARDGGLLVPIDARYPLSQAADAHRHAETRGRIGRVLIMP